jgi:hypothetical protein
MLGLRRDIMTGHGIAPLPLACLLVLPLAIAGCAPDDPPELAPAVDWGPICGPGIALGEAPTITGTLEGWAGGDHGIGLKVYGKDVHGPLVDAGSVAADGSFTLLLPGADVMAPLLGVPGSCFVHYGPKISPPSLRYAWHQGIFAGERASFGQYARHLHDERTIVVEYIYSDQDGTLSGQWKCGAPATLVVADYSFQITLKRGWNVVLARRKAYGGGGGGLTELCSGPMPPNVRWLWKTW